MKSAVRPPRPSSISQKIDEATRQARFRSPLTSRSLKTGTNAAERAESATSDRTVFGIRKAMLKALIGPLIPNRYAATISRTSPRTREAPVATAKMTPDRARLRLSPSGSLDMAAGDGALICIAPASSSSSRAASSVRTPSSRRGRMIAVERSDGSCATGPLSSAASLSKYVGLPCSRRRRSRSSRRSCRCRSASSTGAA